MPGGDRTGPLGRGPMTGRGFGVCRGAAPQGYGYGGYGYGGYGRGCGRGYGPRFFGRQRGYYRYEDAPMETKDVLELEKRELQARIKFIDNQLEDFSEEE